MNPKVVAALITLLAWSAFVAILILNSGCADMLAPRTSLQAGPVRWKNPKDLQIGSLQVTSNTNGAFTLSVSNLTTRMNPEVIAISGQALGNIIKEAVAAGAAAK